MQRINILGIQRQKAWQDDMFFPKPNEPYLFDMDRNPKPAFYEVYKTLRDKSERKSAFDVEKRE